MNYEDRLKISIDGNNKTIFYTKSGLLVATGYDRIVIGDRGPYIEFNDTQINIENFHIPKAEEYRMTSDSVYYIEFRSLDDCNVKVYFQLKEVDYADYKIGKLYISPFSLKTNMINDIIIPIR